MLKVPLTTGNIAVNMVPVQAASQTDMADCHAVPNVMLIQGTLVEI